LQDLSVRVNGIPLAQHVTTRLVDDLDGSDAVATVSFSLDGRSFEIDLSEGHLAELRTALEPFVTVARRLSGGAPPRPGTGRAAAGMGAAVVSSATADEGTSVPAGGRAGKSRPVEGEPKVGREPRVAAVAPAVSTPAPQKKEAPTRQKKEALAPQKKEAVVASEGAVPRPNRKRTPPLVADPFNPDVRIV
jgi:hypothetical protein